MNASQPLTVDRVRELVSSAGADFGVVIASFSNPAPGHTQYLTWGCEPIDKVASSGLAEEISSWINSGGSKVLAAASGPEIVIESFKLDAAKNKAEVERLRAAIALHHSQKADDRCVEDDDRLYAAAGLPLCDRRVGDKAAMLHNCERFIERRCEAGGWPTYAELEAERDALLAFKKFVHARLDACGVAVDPESPHKSAGCRIGGRLDELIGERDRLRGLSVPSAEVAS